MFYDDSSGNGYMALGTAIALGIFVFALFMGAAGKLPAIRIQPIEPGYYNVISGSVSRDWRDWSGHYQYVLTVVGHGQCHSIPRCLCTTDIIDISDEPAIRERYLEAGKGRFGRGRNQLWVKIRDCRTTNQNNRPMMEDSIPMAQKLRLPNG